MIIVSREMFGGGGEKLSNESTNKILLLSLFPSYLI